MNTEDQIKELYQRSEKTDKEVALTAQKIESHQDTCTELHKMVLASLQNLTADLKSSVTIFGDKIDDYKYETSRKMEAIEKSTAEKMEKIKEETTNKIDEFKSKHYYWMLGLFATIIAMFVAAWIKH